MRRLIITAGAAIAVSLVVPLATFATNIRGDAIPGVVVEEQGAISYVSGGIGDEQQKAISAIEKRFNLKLTLATADGKYIGGGDVRIENAAGESVLQTTSKGPLFLAKLPPGSYKVHVNSQGQSFTRNVTVRDGGQQHVNLTWPATTDEPVQAGDSPEDDFRFEHSK